MVDVPSLQDLHRDLLEKQFQARAEVQRINERANALDSVIAHIRDQLKESEDATTGESVNLKLAVYTILRDNPHRRLTLDQLWAEAQQRGVKSKSAQPKTVVSTVIKRLRKEHPQIRQATGGGWVWMEETESD